MLQTLSKNIQNFERMEKKLNKKSSLDQIKRPSQNTSNEKSNRSQSCKRERLLSKTTIDRRSPIIC